MIDNLTYADQWLGKPLNESRSIGTGYDGDARLPPWQMINLCADLDEAVRARVDLVLEQLLSTFGEACWSAGLVDLELGDGAKPRR